ncbi:MAG: hypothetical protein ACR2HS_05710, partial [Gammaproteobacteria bacterium]
MSDVTVKGNSLISNGNVIANFSNINGQLSITFVSTNGTVVTNHIVNEIIQNIKYSNSSSNPPSSLDLNYTFNDGLGYGNLYSISKTVSINIDQVNNPPVNLRPVNQTVNQNSNLVFSLNTGNQISIFDADVNNNNMTITLNVSQGVLNVVDSSYLTTISNNNTNSLTIAGKISDINTVLNGLKYIPNLNFSGADQLQIITNDNGNSGQGGSKIVSNTLDITINQITAPNNTAINFNNLGLTSINTYVEGGSGIFINNLPQFTISDPTLDSYNKGLGNYHGAMITLFRNGGAVSDDVFSFGKMSNVIVSGNYLLANNNIIGSFSTALGQLSIQFMSNNGTLASRSLVNQVLEAIKYSNNSSNPAEYVQLHYIFNDGTNNPGSIISSDIKVNITAINNPPTNNFPLSVN